MLTYTFKHIKFPEADSLQLTLIDMFYESSSFLNNYMHHSGMKILNWCLRNMLRKKKADLETKTHNTTDDYFWTWEHS